MPISSTLSTPEPVCTVKTSGNKNILDNIFNCDKIDKVKTETTLAADSNSSAKRNPKDCPQKFSGGGTPPLPMADLYKHAYQEVWKNLASWKRDVITDENGEGVDRITRDFINQVEQEVNRLTAEQTK